MKLFRFGLRKLRLVLGAGLSILVGACAYHGNVDNPVVQRFTWFSYLDGSDIRAACQAGSPDRYRLVYNARYNEQARSYEVVGLGKNALLVSRARRTPYAFQMTEEGFDFLGQFRKSETPLNPKEFEDFKARLGQSGVFEATPVGLRLPSNQFYWTAAACQGGQFHFNAFLYPSASFAKLTFPPFLFARDKTGISVNAPRSLPPATVFDTTMAGQPRDDARPDFNPFVLTVEANGLGGLARLF